MRKFLIRYLAFIALTLSFGAQAALIDAGTFSKGGDAYVASPFSGNTSIVYSFNNLQPLDINFSGTHEGWALDDMLLTNVATGDSYHLGTTFSETLSLGMGSQLFTLSGFALNALDPRIYSDYDMQIKAVPLPAAAWLFGSALLGFVSFSRRRKV